MVILLTRGTLQNFDFAKTCVAALELKTVTFVVPIVSDLSLEFLDPSQVDGRRSMHLSTCARAVNLSVVRRG